MNKAYLGDGVYVERTSQGVVLTTENGISTTNSIWLEPEVLSALMEWVAAIVTKSVNTAPPCAPQPVRSEPDTANRTTGLLGGKDSIVREYPTPTEQRDAWVRRNGSDELDEEAE